MKDLLSTSGQYSEEDLRLLSWCVPCVVQLNGVFCFEQKQVGAVEAG